MKKITLIIVGILFYALGKSQDLTINQINLGYSYDATTGMISNLHFDVMNVDNTNDVNFSFKVAALLSDPIVPTTIYEVDRFTLNSLSASSSVPISNWDIDLTSVSGLPSGNYRLGVYVDIDGDASETDETNNYYYFSPAGNNLAFNISGVNEVESVVSDFGNYPNPAVNITNFKFSLIEKAAVTLIIYDVTGKQVIQLMDKDLFAGTYTVGFDAATLPDGIYYYTLKASNNRITKKLIMNRE